MLQSVWLRLRGSRSLLPGRDIFDADLDRARSKAGCALCRLIQEQRLYEQQLQHITALDKSVEAYLARFNASKRERGEVPDMPEAAWAWERLLAFFVGEPALEYRRADDWPSPSKVHEIG